MAKKRSKTIPTLPMVAGYDQLLSGISTLLEQARRTSARTVNSVLTATYYKIGRRIVEFEQGGKARAEYGRQLIERLAADLTLRHGRGFSERNVWQMKGLYLGWKILPTPSAELQVSVRLDHTDVSPLLAEDSSQVPNITGLIKVFPLPWSHYVRLMAVENPHARAFYEKEALRGGWSVRQLHRQIESQFYERTLLSRNKAAMLTKGTVAKPEDQVTPEEEIKDPFVLEFLDLKDEYSETQLEEALIRHLEIFLLELGDDFAFVGRQKRLRIDDQWFRVDLVFFHRRLKCLVIIDLKTGAFTHADAGQMHLYLNYARDQWMREGENPPVGLILCAAHGANLRAYALDGLPNKVMAATYRTVLPDEATLVAELDKTQKMLENRMLTLHKTDLAGGIDA